MSRNARESRIISQQQEQCLGTIMSIQDYYHLKDHKKLIAIILDQKQSERLFYIEKTMVSNIFNSKNPEAIQRQKIDVFASKYTYEQLVEKYPRPKAGTNDVLISILRKKMETQVILSHKTRKSIWLLASGARFALNTHRGLYENLVNYNQYPSYFERQIDLDLGRTVGKDSLNSNIQLKVFEKRLNCFFKEKPIHWILSGIEFYCLFYTHHAVHLRREFLVAQPNHLNNHTHGLLHKYDRRRSQGIETENDIKVQVSRTESISSVYTVVRVFVCFIFAILCTLGIMQLAKLVWDRLFIEGTSALIKTGVIIMGYFEQQILNAQQFGNCEANTDEIIMIIDNNSKNLQVSEEQFNKQYEKIYINTRGLKIARQLYREYHIMQKLAERHPINRKKKEEVLECNIDWPICVHYLQKNRREKKENEVWIFRQDNPPKIIHDYLVKEEERLKASSNMGRSTVSGTIIAKFKNAKSSAEEYTIGRFEHICCEKTNRFKKLPRVCQKEQQKLLSSIMEDPIQQTYKQDNGIEQENTYLNKQIKRLSKIQGNQMYVKSQTMVFFHDFVARNQQLANIIVKESQIDQNQ